MFTGIVEEKGKVRSIRNGARSSQLTIGASHVVEDLKIGDSICTNGVCLTVTAFGKDFFEVDVMPETIRKTNLHLLKNGSEVNLERALRLSDRLGGHLVNGHVDGTGKIIRRWEEDNAVWFQVAAGPDILRYVVDKGSVTLDGISLTVTVADSQSITVSTIPHTRDVTTLQDKKAGDILNIECDVIAKYVEKLQKQPVRDHPIDVDYLARNGFL
jgi:riboflavin synthase